MATKKAAKTPPAARANIYLKFDAKKKLDAVAAAERRGTGLVIEDAIELYIQKLPANTRQLYDLFMKQ
jgi:predicted transcriptional regulator